jgi:hypothetical protein
MTSTTTTPGGDPVWAYVRTLAPRPADWSPEELVEYERLRSIYLAAVAERDGRAREAEDEPEPVAA